jgi:carbonic anhydrase
VADETETSADDGAATGAPEEPKKKAGFLNFKDPNLLPAAFIAIGLSVGGRLSAPPSAASAEKAPVEAESGEKTEEAHSDEEPGEDAHSDDMAAEDSHSDEKATDDSHSDDMAAEDSHSDEKATDDAHSDDMAAEDDHADEEAAAPRTLSEKPTTNIVSSSSAASTAEKTSHWDYENTDEWGDLSEEYAACVDGSAQSPIDIKDPLVIGLTDLRFAYAPSIMTVSDNGHAVQAMIPEGSTLTIDGMSFALRQLHFHAPSEHTVRGRTFPAEVHLVHQAADGTLAVVGMMIEVGEEHPSIAELWAAIPGEGESMDTAGMVDPNQLLPGNRSAIRYAGSLTTPPCTEAVRWNLLVEPITMSQAQLDALTSIHVGNARPVQPTNGRSVVVDSGPDA